MRMKVKPQTVVSCQNCEEMVPIDEIEALRRLGVLKEGEVLCSSCRRFRVHPESGRLRGIVVTRLKTALLKWLKERW